MTDVFPQVEKEIEAEKPTPIVAIPFIVLIGLCLVLVAVVFIATLFMMAGWFPTSMTFMDERYYGSDILNYVIMRNLVRVLLVLWPIMSAFAIVGELQDRKRRASKA